MNPSNSQQALDQLTAFRGTMKNPGDILAAYKDKYNVGGVNDRVQKLRGSIINTENLLGGVDASVTGRTSGTLTTEAARQRIVANERAPISETLATQQSGLTAEQQNLQDLTGEASTGAQLEYGGQQDQMGYLKNIYDVLFNKEQEAEKKRQFDEQMALERQKASDAARAALASFGGGGGGPAAPATAPTDPLAQIAYNDVRTRVSQQSDAALKGDYNATAASAGYGNAKDKLKLTYYKQLRPDLFGNYTPPKPVAAKPAPPAIKTQIANFATKPGPGNLSTGNASNNMKQWFGWLPWSGQH